MSTVIPIAIAFFCMTIGYITRRWPQLPSEVGYVPDMVIGVAAFAVVGALIKTRAWVLLPMRYVLVFLCFLYVVVSGLIVNEVSGDTAFAGVRSYLKYLPIFLIPFAFNQSEKSLRLVMLGILALLLLQVPVTIWQRFFEFRMDVSGDEIRGTLTTTSSVAILGAGAVLMTMAHLVDKKIGLFPALLLALALLVPAGLSETKATPIFFAAGALALLIARRSQVTAKTLAHMAIAGVGLMATFVIVYDNLYSGDTRRGYFEKLAPAASLDNYNMTGVGAAEFKIARNSSYQIVGVEEQLRDEADKNVGRLDSIRLPFEALYPSEIINLLIGFGIGNVDSDFGSGGDYQKLKKELGASTTTLSILLWETGLLGTILYSIFIGLVARDAWVLSKSDVTSATLGLSMVAIVVVWSLALIYSNLFHHSEVLMLAFYLSGVAVSRRERFRQKKLAAWNPVVNEPSGAFTPSRF